MAKASPLLCKTVSDAFDLLDALDTRLLNVRHLARAYADMTGVRPGDTLQMDAEAIGSTMSFFADELATARESLADIHRLVLHLRVVQ